jgi:hypothetical protein
MLLQLSFDSIICGIISSLECGVGLGAEWENQYQTGSPGPVFFFVMLHKYVKMGAYGKTRCYFL